MVELGRQLVLGLLGAISVGDIENRSPRLGPKDRSDQPRSGNVIDKRTPCSITNAEEQSFRDAIRSL